MAITVGTYHGGTGNMLTIRGGLRARVVSAREIEVEFADDFDSEPINNGYMDVFVGGTRYLANPVNPGEGRITELWPPGGQGQPPHRHRLRVQFLSDVLTASAGDIRIALQIPHGGQNGFGGTATNSLWLKWDGTAMTRERAEYEEYVVEQKDGGDYTDSKPSSQAEIDAIPSGAWTVLAETPERLIAKTAALRLNGARVMQWNGCYVLNQGFFRDVHWTWEMTVRHNQPSLTGTTASEASDVFLNDEDAFDRSGTRRGGVDYGGRVVKLRKVWEAAPERYQAQNPPTSTTTGAAAGGTGWGASGAKFVGVTCGIGIRHPGARVSWHAVRQVVDIPVSGTAAARLFGVANSNPLSHINVSYEVTDNWSLSGFAPSAYLARFDTASGTAQAHTPGYCRWRLINVYPHLGTATGDPSFDELVHLYGSHEARKYQARLNGGGTPTVPRVLEGYSVDVTNMLFNGSFDLVNPFIDVSAINRPYLAEGDPDFVVDVRQDVSWRVVGTSADAAYGKVRAHTGGPSLTGLAAATENTSYDTLTAAQRRALTGTLRRMSVWESVGNSGLADNRKILLTYRRADLLLDSVTTLEPDTENGARSAVITAARDPAFTGTPAQAAALAPRFTVSRTAKLVTVTDDATAQELYNWLKHYYSETDAAAADAVPATLAGGTLTLAEGWTIEVATGVTLSGTAAAARLELSSEHPWPYPLPAWASGTTYAPGSIVSHNSRTWRTPSTVAGLAPGAPTAPWADISRVGVVVLAGTGSLSRLTYTDASGRAITVQTEPGARVIVSQDRTELRYAVPEATGGRLKVFRRSTRASAISAGADIVLSGVTAAESVRGLAYVPERGGFLAGIYNPTSRASRVAAFDGNGRLEGSSPLGPSAPFTSVYTAGRTEVSSIAYRNSRVAWCIMRDPAHPANTGGVISVFDPSPLYAGGQVAARNAHASGYQGHSMSWTGTTLLVAFFSATPNHYVMYGASPDASGRIAAFGPNDAFNESSGPFGGSVITGGAPVHIGGMAVHHEPGSTSGLWLAITSGTGATTVDYPLGASAHHVLEEARGSAVTLPGITAARAIAVYEVAEPATEDIRTAGADGAARFPVGGGVTMVRATAKKDGYAYATATLETATPSHALALARDASVDLAQDISDYDLTSAGPAAKGVYVAPQASGASKYVYFADTYDLKASPEKSKRVLDAALGTDDGLRLLHRYAQAPSLNNGGRVVSFHPSYVNILTGWIEFVRKAGLPPNSRAVFGAATYTGDDETFYRPPELNGGHVEVADPTVYVQFDSARIRRVTQEVISDAGNQAAIASAVLGAIPEGDEDSDPATTKTVSNVLYELRNGPGSGGGGGLTDAQGEAIERLTQARADAIDRIPDPWPDAPLSADNTAAAVWNAQRATYNEADSFGRQVRTPAVSVLTEDQIRSALTSAPLGTFDPAAVPTTLGGVLTLLSRLRLVREGSQNAYSVEARLEGEHPNVPTGLIVPSADNIADAVNSRAPPGTLADGSIGDRLAGVQGVTDDIDFVAGTGKRDIKATLGTETVSLSANHGLATEAKQDTIDMVVDGIKAKTDRLDFQDEGTGPSPIKAREQDPLTQRAEPPQATAVAQAVVENATWLEMRRDIALARKMQTNRQLRDGTASRYTTYDDDGTTPIVSHDLKDSEGAPAEHNEPYERVRRTA